MSKSTYKLRIIKEVVLLILLILAPNKLIFTIPKSKVMKNILIILIAILGGISTVSAQNVPKIQFKTDVIDYGEIKKDSDGVKVFQFTNTGNAPLIVESVYSSCGCTTPSWTKTAVPPGGSGEIQVKYNTSIVGPIRRTITVYSNAEENPKAIKIKGKVLDPDS